MAMATRFNKRSNAKRFLAFLAIVSMLSLSFANVQASSIEGFIVDSSTPWAKWDVRHMGSKSTTYRYVTVGIQNTYSTYVTNGIAMWGSAINCSYSSSSKQGLINTTYSTEYGANAYTTSNYDPDKHVTSWTLTICVPLFNASTNSDAGRQRTIAHEIGHVYGLDHVGLSSQIMYGYYSASKSVTSYDIAGMNVMTHTHTHDTTFSGSITAYDNTSHLTRCPTGKASERRQCTYTTYHSGSKHYLAYNCTCKNKYSYSWACSGPPCKLPFSNIPETK